MADEEELTQEDRDAIDVLLAKAEALDDALRKVGLYVDRTSVVQVPTIGGYKWALAVEMLVGDVAFSKRIQDPEQAKIDKQFAEMTFGYGTDEFLNTRERIKKNLAEGKSIFDRRDDDG